MVPAMPAAVPPPSEARRQAVLDGLGLLDTPRDPAFDLIVDAASQVLDMPISLISLVDRQRVWFKARVGLEAPEADRALAFCAHAILQDTPLVVPDTARDRRFADNPLVTGESSVRAYAGVPLRVGPDLAPVGTLCVLDTTRVRPLSADEVGMLDTLARLVSALIHAPRDPARAAADLLGGDMMAMLRLPGEDGAGRLLCSPRVIDATGQPPDQAQALWLEYLLCLDRPHPEAAILRQALDNGLPAQGLTRLRTRGESDSSGLPCRCLVVPVVWGGEPATAVVLLPPAAPDMDSLVMSGGEHSRRAVIAHGFDGIWSTDRDQRLRLFAVRTGAQVESLLPQRIGIGPRLWEMADLIPDGGWTALREAMQQRQLLPAVRVLWQQRDRWLELSGFARDADPQVHRGYSGLVRDVTDAQRRQIALQASEQRFRDFARMSSDWFWETDEQLRFRFVEGSFTRPFGFKASELIGRTYADLAASGPDSAVLARLHQICSSRKPFHALEFELRGRSGRLRWLRVNGQPFLAPDGQFAGYRGTAEDITRARLAEAEAARQQGVAEREREHLRELLDRMDVGVAVYDARRISYCNQAFADLLHHPSAQALVGTSLESLLPPDEQIGMRAWFRQMRLGKAIRPAVRTLLRADGTPVRALVSPVRIQWDGVSQVMGVVQSAGEHDLLKIEMDSVHERHARLLSDELDSQQRRIAQDLHDVVGSELAGLSLVLGGVRAGLDPQRIDVARVDAALARALDSLAQLAGSVRSYAHSLAPVEASAGGLSQALRRFADDLTQLQGIECELVVDADADPDEALVANFLYRIVQEAVHNAVRHGKARRLRITLTRGDGELALAVQDDGSGFDAEQALQSRRGGLGLNSMLARAQAIGATLDFGRSALGGAQVRAVRAWPKGSNPSVKRTIRSKGT